MIKDKFIEDEMNKLIQKGSNKEDLVEMLKDIKNKMRNIDNCNPDEIIKEISEEVMEETYNYRNKKNEQGESMLDGITTCIYLPNEKGEYKIKFISGKNSEGKSIDENTKFDIASVTKLYTLLLTFKLVEHGYIKLTDKIVDLDSHYQGLQDFTIEDLIRLCGEINTVGRVNGGANKEEALQILQTAFLKSNDRTTNLYTDIGGIIISKVIEKVVNEKDGTNLSYDQIMNKYILEPCGLKDTQFNPKSSNLAGNGNNKKLVHDPKARILGGNVGSAGIFTTSDDMAKLASKMFEVNYVNYNYLTNLISKENLYKLGTHTFYNTKQSNKGLLGMYQKSDDPAKFLCPLAYADNTFTAQGFTGAAATFDSKNQIHNNYMINSIKDGAAKKPDGFIQAFKDYQRYIVGQTLNILVIKHYYDMMEKENNYNKVYCK